MTCWLIVVARATVKQTIRLMAASPGCFLVSHWTLALCLAPGCARNHLKLVVVGSSSAYGICIMHQTRVGSTDICKHCILSSILDGGARVDSGAFTSCLRGASLTMVCTKRGGSICASARAPGGTRTRVYAVAAGPRDHAQGLMIPWLVSTTVFASVSGTNRLRGLAPTNAVTLWTNCWRRGNARRSNNATSSSRAPRTTSTRPVGFLPCADAQNVI